MNPDDTNKIEELKKSLYSRGTPDVRTRRKLRFSDIRSGVQKSWTRKEEKADASRSRMNVAYEHHVSPFFKRLLLGSLIFCIAAIGIGAYIFFNGSNLVSADNIDIAIDAPVSIAGGAPITFDVTVSNKNSVDLQLVDLEVDFPDGTVDPANPTQPLKEYQGLLGDINAGASAKKTISAIIFGEENTQKEVTASVTYKIKGSTSVFTKSKTYDLLVNSSPISVTASSVDQITSGQPFDLTLTVASNSQNVLKSVLLEATYPFGFTFASASPMPLTDQTTWNIGDIPPGATRTIVIHGVIEGEDTDVRVFHFAVGSQSPTATNAIGTEYDSIVQQVSIEKPFMSVGMSVDGDAGTGDHIAQSGQPIQVQLSWFNNLSTPVTDAQIQVSLAGTAYDKGSVQPQEGYFDSSADTITWDQKSVPALASVGAGAGGTVNFSITPRIDVSSSQPVVDPSMSLDVSVSGDRAQQSGVSGTLASTLTRELKLSSDISLSGRVIRSIGPFQNIGPIPPKANQATTYTIVWDVDNTSNSVSGGQVVATLPSGVKWLGNASPSSESVSYDVPTGTVTWNVGSLPTYTQSQPTRREVSFQVSIEPNVNQVSTAPTLVNDATFSAIDDFTNANLTSVQPSLTTSFSTDPAYVEGDETVTQ